jgi:ClpX C4-type zinc finger
MTDTKSIGIGKSLAIVWGKLMMQKQYNNALLTGILGYRVSIEAQDVELKVGAFSWIQKTIQEMIDNEENDSLNEAGEMHSCSFCGRGEPEVRLAAGARAFICDSCISILSETFATGEGNDDDV